MHDLETVYDDEISPLMEKIIAICHKHEMPMLASFCYRDNDGDGQDFCTTYINPAGRHVDALREAAAIVQYGPKITAFTITTVREKQE